MHADIDQCCPLSGKFDQSVFSQKVYSGSASQCRLVDQSEASKVILCRPITVEENLHTRAVLPIYILRTGNSFKRFFP